MNIMKTRLKRKTLLLSLVLILLLTAGVTIAFIVTGTQDLNNSFKPTAVTCEVVEGANGSGFDQTKKVDVKIKNSGSIPAYIRAEIVFTWQNEQGHVLGVPVTTNDYEIDMGDSDKWILKDGFYYYTDKVAGDGITDELIDRCEPVAERVPDGYFLSVEIIASAIQADGESFSDETGGKGKKPAEIAWSNDKVTVTVNDDATLSIENK